MFRIINITLQVLLFGTGIGTIVSLFTIGFVYGVKYLSDFRTSFSTCFLEYERVCFSLSPLIFLFVAASIIIIFKKTLHISRYHGPADVILVAHSNSQFLDPKTGFLSTFAAFISASGGASVGQYGPLVHLGGTIGSIFNKMLPSLLSKDIYIGCGVATAISAGFNSPLGGIIFAHEAIIRHFSFKAIAPIAVSSVVGATFTNSFFPSAIIFQTVNTNIDLVPSITYSFLLGPVCAVFAVIFMRSLLSLQGNLERLSKNELTRIFYATLVCGLIGGFVPQVLGLGGETITAILDDLFSIEFLFIILLLKLIVTVCCLSLGFFGGVFSPALVLGAALGGIFTYVGNYFGMFSLGDSMIFAGMAALSASVIGAPIATIVIIFELTRSYDIAFISIICVSGSCLVSTLIFGHSFFDKQLLNRNFKISRGRTEILLSERLVINLTGNNKYLSVPPKVSKEELMEMFQSSGFTEAYIVENKKLIAKLRVNDLLNFQTGEIIGDKNPLTLNSNLSVSESIEKASNFVGESLPVVDNENNLLGVVTESDLFKEYLSTQTKISNIEKD